MFKIKKKIVEYYTFFCPACKHEHTYSVLEDGSLWQFNGNIESPSFTPSLLNRDFDNEGKVKSICHLFITNGMIVYCGDCTHELSGKTVDLPNIY